MNQDLENQKLSFSPSYSPSQRSPIFKHSTKQIPPQSDQQGFVRKNRHTKSQLKRLRTEDFALRKKLMNQGFCGKISIIINNVRQQINILLEDPQSSKIASLIQYSVLINIVISCIAIIVDSMDEIQSYDLYQSMTYYLEMYLFSFFALEYLLRLVSFTAFGRNIKQFIFAPMNFFDVAALTPFILQLIISGTSYKQLRVMRLIRFLRIFRIFKVSRYIKDMELLTATVKNSLKDIIILLCIFCVLVLCFATAIYHMEYTDDQNTAPEQIHSIADAIWFSLTTMTTVGYGDKLALTIQGKVFTGMAAFCGIITISLPVAVISMGLTATLKQSQETLEVNELKSKFAKQVEQELKDVPNYDEQKYLNVQELKFMEKRLELLFENSQTLLNLVERSQDLFDKVTADLMSLYSALSEQMDMHLEHKLKNLKTKQRIMKIEKQMTQQKGIAIGELVNKYKESQKMISQASILQCEQSEQDIDCSVISSRKKQSLKKSSIKFINGVQKAISRSSKNHINSINDILADSKSDIADGNKSMYQGNFLDQLASNLDFKDILDDPEKGDDDENIQNDEQCDLSSKVNNLSFHNISVITEFKKAKT